MNRIVGSVVVALVAVIVGGVLFLVLKGPARRPPSTETIAATPALVARGRYVAEIACMHCHTAPDPTRWTLLGRDEVKGAGGLCWDEKTGFPGRICSTNLTPDRETGLGAWTDGEIVRAIREGVARDGRPLVPLMPYSDFREMSDDDVRAVVAFLRTLTPVRNPVPTAQVTGPLKYILKFMPRPLDGPVAGPPPGDRVANGRYLTTIALCKSCHTPTDGQHRPLPGKAFAGGRVFTVASNTVVSSNLTPHATGLGARTKESFVATFRSFATPELRAAKIDPKRNTVMPWLTLAVVTDEDLGAIYDYLRTLPAVSSVVPRDAGAD